MTTTPAKAQRILDACRADPRQLGERGACGREQQKEQDRASNDARDESPFVIDAGII
jgi:hypothetical protein